MRPLRLDAQGSFDAESLNCKNKPRECAVLGLASCLYSPSYRSWSQWNILGPGLVIMRPGAQGVDSLKPSLIRANSVAKKPEVISSSNPRPSGGHEYIVCTVGLNPGLTLPRTKMLLS